MTVSTLKCAKSPKAASSVFNRRQVVMRQCVEETSQLVVTTGFHTRTQGETQDGGGALRRGVSWY